MKKVKIMEGCAKSLPPETVQSMSKSSIMENSMANQSLMITNIDNNQEKQKEILQENTLLVKQSKLKLLKHILATDKSTELKAELLRPPNAFLKLQHIYGADTSGRRNLIKFIHEKIANSPPEQTVSHGCRRRVLYSVSKYMVNEACDDKSQKIYDQHIQKITCYAIHNDFIASADMGSNIHFWNHTTNLLIKITKLTMDQTGISHINFSEDGELVLAVTSSKQCLVILNWEQDLELASKCINEVAIFDIKFDPTNRNKMVAIGAWAILELEFMNGTIVVTNFITFPAVEVPMSVQASSITKAVLTIPSPVCMDFLVYNRGETKIETDLYIGISSGEIGVLISHQYEKLSNGPVHTGSINSLLITKNFQSPVCIITSGDDNFIKVWDLSLNLLCSINVPALEIYKPSPKFGSGIPTTFLNGISSFDICSCHDTKFAMLFSLKCGDILISEFDIENSELEKSLQDAGRQNRKIGKTAPKCYFHTRNHSSIGKIDERKVCVVPVPSSNFIISSGDDCTLRLWNLEDNSLVWMEDLGISRNMRVSAMCIDPTGDILVIGFRSGKVVFYKLYREEVSGMLLKKIVKVSMRCTVHDSTNMVLAIKFSTQGDFLAIAYSYGKQPSSTEDTRESAGGVFIYERNPIKTAKELYIKSKWIEIPMFPSKEQDNLNQDTGKAPCHIEFSDDNEFLQICFQTLTKSGTILYQKDPTCIVWDIERKAVVEDWDQLKYTKWNGLAFAPSIIAKSIDSQYETDTVLTTAKIMGEKPQDLVCAGSAFGDLHVFKFAALLVDKKEPVMLVKSGKEKEFMGLSKSCNALCSYIDSISISGEYSDNPENVNCWFLITGNNDEVILKYEIHTDEKHANLDYLQINPILCIEDPFEEFPSKEKFFLLLDERWNVRSSMGVIPDKNITMSQNNSLCPINMQVGWVYGRRAFDRRNNLKFDYLKRIVYPAGTMLVIVNENAQLLAEKEIPGKTQKKQVQQIILNSASENNVYPEISCIAMSNSKHLVAIGTAEAQAHIYAWDISTDAEMSVTTIKKASIIHAIKIHKNERYCVAIALSHDYRQIVLIADLWEGIELCRDTQLHSLAFKIRDIEFYPGETYTDFVTCGIQHLSFWKKHAKFISQEAADLTISNDAIIHLANPGAKSGFEENKTAMNISTSILNVPTKPCGAQLFCDNLNENVENKEKTITSMSSDKLSKNIVYATFTAIGFIGQIMLTIADDGNVYLWEKSKIIRKRQGHSGPILALDIKEKNRLVVTGGLDGRVVLWSYNEKSAYGRTDLEKIRSIHLKTDQIYEKSIQSVCMDHGTLMVGTRSGSIYLLNVADENDIIKPKQSDLESFTPYLQGVDNEIPADIAFDPLNNRICYLSKKGLFAVLSVESQLLVFSRNYGGKGKMVHIFRTTGDVLLGFENEILILSSKYAEIPGMKVTRANITAAKVSYNDKILAVATVDKGVPKITLFDIFNNFSELYSTDKGYKSSIIYLDFTADDIYFFAGDELGENFIYETDQLQERKKDDPVEVELEWLSWGIKYGDSFPNISKHYSHNNKITAVRRIPYKKDISFIIVGDQSGSVFLRNFIKNS